MENETYLELLPESNYEDSCFENCLFSGTDLSRVEFTDCRFVNCMFTQVKLTQTAFRTVHFEQCKMQGLIFDACNPFLLELHCTDCQLDYSSLFKLNLKGSTFHNCRMLEVDFTACNLREGSLQGSNLSGARFENSVLIETNCVGVQGFILNPNENQVQGMQVEQEALSGLLQQYKINIVS